MTMQLQSVNEPIMTASPGNDDSFSSCHPWHKPGTSSGCYDTMYPWQPGPEPGPGIVNPVGEPPSAVHRSVTHSLAHWLVGPHSPFSIDPLPPFAHPCLDVTTTKTSHDGIARRQTQATFGSNTLRYDTLPSMCTWPHDVPWRLPHTSPDTESVRSVRVWGNLGHWGSWAKRSASFWWAQVAQHRHARADPASSR